ncbi:sporulation protein [Thioalkalivibrio denitrificans]|uniref:Sporulation protein n=1 Tax=Thioalkalivibrio denitrificans TaxID=108003 RepID=A0A1V3NCE8_9GAMM|nr:SPOR domain-containing protein [Thioalkalivibrio denitrificans]OOG22446.1 sporulation protein [Thioalkalivibrio denitrificans]
MDPRLKQRLVGAAVLLALAVIFLPMLLDGGGRDATVSLREAIPPEPEFARPDAAPPLPLDAPPGPPAGETRAPTPGEARSLPEPVPPRLARPDPPPERTPTEAPATPVTDPGGFAVQVGSFGEEANARAERDRLRELGYTAFVEPTRADGRALYRVKIGPVAERAEAERLRERLREQLDLTGIVVAHP